MPSPSKTLLLFSVLLFCRPLFGLSSKDLSLAIGPNSAVHVQDNKFTTNRLFFAVGIYSHGALQISKHWRVRLSSVAALPGAIGQKLERTKIETPQTVFEGDASYRSFSLNFNVTREIPWPWWPNEKKHYGIYAGLGPIIGVKTLKFSPSPNEQGIRKINYDVWGYSIGLGVEERADFYFSKDHPVGIELVYQFARAYRTAVIGGTLIKVKTLSSLKNDDEHEEHTFMVNINVRLF